MSNTRIWDALGKTDPAQTKPFQRAGGFSGTAVKPMWSFKRMTEHFGPCGIGWGTEAPSFQVERAGEEMMVFCTAGIWYVENDKRSMPVYGVGGDKFYISGSKGFRSSDEAFKAAYTDALGNAMKLIGVAADVHMGLFDDNKYVREVAETFRPQTRRLNQELKDSIDEEDELAFLNRDERPVASGPTPIKAIAKSNAGNPISEAQVKRLFAIGRSKNTDVLDFIGSYGYETAESIGWKDYKKICDALEAM
jgi:hypothetical protein